MRTEEERRDFSKFQVDLVYLSQDGICPLCGAGLEQTGFHRHHKNGDANDNSLGNLQLVCPRCHHSKSGLSNPYTQHKEQEKIVLGKLNEIVQLILEPQIVEVTDSKGNKATKALELSGVVLEKLVDALTMSLKVSRNTTDVDYGREFTPDAIKIQRKMIEATVSGDAYIEGYMTGVKDTLSKVEFKK